MNNKIKNLREEAEEEINCGNSKEKAYGRGILYAMDVLLKKPSSVEKIISSLDENKDLYEECKRMIEELEKIGWTADYELSGELVDLRQIPMSLTLLNSVGCYINHKNSMVYPEEAIKNRRVIDESKGIHLSDCTNEWMHTLSMKDLFNLHKQ